MPASQRTKNILKNINVLVADGDEQLAGVLKENLTIMGFSKFRVVHSGQAVIDALLAEPADVIVTEWPMQPVDGMDLVNFIRKDPSSPDRLLPIIMLTGKGERADVEAARDIGVTEFVVKPYDSQTLFDRVEQVVEHPRGLILSDNFTGPDRRRRERQVEAGNNRRKIKPFFIRPEDVARWMPGDPPRIIPPDNALKRKLGVTDSLLNIITPDVLKEAQTAIDNLRDESLLWIREDMRVLKKASEILMETETVAALEKVKQTALSIKSRAGMFGYPIATDIARLLYLFLCTDFSPANPKHGLIIAKHIDALKLIFGNKCGAVPDEMHRTLVAEMEAMVRKSKK